MADVPENWTFRYAASAASGGGLDTGPHGFPSLCRSGHRLRARERGLGAADRIRARFRGIARLRLAAVSRLGRAGRHRRIDRDEWYQLLAGLDRRGAWRGVRRLAVLLDRAEARIVGAAYLAAIAPSGFDPARRTLHEDLGHSRHLHRPLLRAVARLGAADRRYFRDAVLAFSGRQFLLGFRLGGGAAHSRRRDIDGVQGFLVIARLIRRRRG